MEMNNELNIYCVDINKEVKDKFSKISTLIQSNFNDSFVIISKIKYYVKLIYKFKC